MHLFHIEIQILWPGIAQAEIVLTIGELQAGASVGMRFERSTELIRSCGKAGRERCELGGDNRRGEV